LWASRGNGAFEVKDVEPGVIGSFPGSLKRVGKRLYFTAFVRGSGMELWMWKP